MSFNGVDEKYVTEEMRKALRYKEDYLQLILEVAADYDGCRTAEKLMELVDELAAYASYARDVPSAPTVLLKYKGYSTKPVYDAYDRWFSGKIEGIKDLSVFHSEHAEGIENEFHSAVDDYLEFCREVGKEPQRPE